MKCIAHIKMIPILLSFIALLPVACGLVKMRDLPEIKFDEITFRSSWTQSGHVQLVNGEYRERAAPGSATQTVVRLTDNIAVAKIDDKDAAAVILVTDPDGSGTFYDLALLVRGPEGWINQDVAFLGDRIKIHSLAIVNDEIAINMTTHGPEDAMCCPTRQVVQRFVLNGHRLMKTTGEDRSTADQKLIDTTWKWQQTLYSNDTKAVPPNPENYTLKLLPDGTVAIRADCNLGGGVYRLDGSSISIEITHTTRAACPPGSLEQVYIRDLNAATIYFMKDDALYFDLKYDTGTMRFMR
jgi:heat shock protein HslJ